MKVLEHGFVELIDFMGGDRAVCDAARVLQEKEVSTFTQKDADLIEGMMSGRHGTPFEHTLFKFRVKCPIFVIREWHRHRMCSYNEISMRWMKGEPEFYVPKPENVRTVKEGTKKISYQYQGVIPTDADNFIRGLKAFHTACYQSYELALESVAPEQARYFLPNTFFTQMIWTVNCRSLMNFLSLRNEDHAMWEIREYAAVVEYAFETKMPETYNAFLRNGRRAP